MPYWKEKSGQTVGDTLGILKHIAQTHKPALMGSDADKPVIDMMAKVVVELSNSLAELCYKGEQD